MCTIQLMDQLPYLIFLASSHCFIIMPLTRRDFQPDLGFITTCLIVLLNKTALSVYFYFHNIQDVTYTYVMKNYPELRGIIII